MKQFFAVCAVLLLGISAQAQEFKPFKVNVSLGAALPSGGGGVLFSIEPKYGVSDQIDIGLRFEAAVMARAVTVNGNSFTGDLKTAGSSILTGNYTFSSGGFRPFVGAGFGLFGIASTDVAVTDNTSRNGSISAGNVFGGMFRAGFKTGHFVMDLEYNLIPNTTSILYTNTGSSQIGTSVESKNSYIGVKLGFDIGGGRR